MDRTDYIGGTDIAAICGESQFANIHDVFLEKMGLIDAREPSMNMDVGTHMESFIAGKYEKRTGRALMTAGQIVHPEFPFIAGHPDRFIIDEKGFIGINEIKNVTFQRDKWGDDGGTVCPLGYQIQVMTYAGIKNALGKKSKRVDITALIGNQDLRIYPLGWHEELFDNMLKLGVNFWTQHILPAREAKAAGKDWQRFAPQVDETESASRMLKALWPSHSDSEVEATGEIEMAIYALVEARMACDEASTDKRRFENQIKAFMQDNGVLNFPDGRITYRQSKDTEKVDWNKVALDLGYIVGGEEYEALAEKHTTTKPGSRRFLVPKRKEENV